MTASVPVNGAPRRASPAVLTAPLTDDVYASPPRILPHSGVLQQSALPAGVRRPVAHRPGYPTPQASPLQTYGEMTSLVASRYGERYASAPALSSETPNATLSYHTRTMYNNGNNNNRIANNNQIVANHYNTLGHRRYHTPIGNSTAELSVFNSDAPVAGQRYTSNNDTNTIKLITPSMHNSLDRRLFTRNNQTQTGRNHTLTMMRHHHHIGRNSSVSWQNQSSPHHQQQQTTSPPILTPSPSDSGFASGIENSANDLTVTRGSRGLTSITPSGVSVVSGISIGSNRTASSDSNATGRVCRSSKIYINSDGEFISDNWNEGKNNERTTGEKDIENIKSYAKENSVSNEIFNNEKSDNTNIKDCDKCWDYNKAENSKNSNECHQVAQLRSKLEEALWEQGRIRGEAALLRQQLKETRSALSSRELDLMRLRHDTKQSFECPGDSQCAESQRLRAELSERICEFESERERWLREKKQVLRYQRCLLQQLADATEEQV